MVDNMITIMVLNKVMKTVTSDDFTCSSEEVDNLKEKVSGLLVNSKVRNYFYNNVNYSFKLFRLQTCR